MAPFFSRIKQINARGGIMYHAKKLIVIRKDSISRKTKIII